MPTEVYEQQLDILADTLEPAPVTAASFPHLELRSKGERRMTEVRALTLENAFVRAQIAPGLGGRLLSLLDKRTGIEALPCPPDLSAQAGGPRGLHWPAGIQIIAGDSPRRTSLGAVDEQVREAADEDSPAGVILHELAAGLPISWTACWSLAPDEAVLRCEVKLFNRSEEPVDCMCGFELPASDRGLGAWRIVNSSDENGMACLAPGPESATLWPGETKTFSLAVVPFTNLPGLAAVSEQGCLGLQGDRVAVQAARRRAASRLELEAGGQKMQAAVDLHPEHIASALCEEAPSTVLLTAPDGTALLRYPMPDPLETLPSALTQTLANAPDGSAEAALLAAARNEGSLPSEAPSGLKACWWRLKARDHVRAQEWSLADRALEQSLLYDSENPLAWWLKGRMQARLNPDGERAEILNAHYLAPMEPMLRVETFLFQGASLDREPNPILAPIARNPDAALDCVCRLIDLGMTLEAGKLLDELLRHESTPMLRLMLAWLLQTRSRMAVEAAQHIQALRSAPLQPPFPWRPMERKAVAEMAEAFPGHPWLEPMAALPTSGGPQSQPA